MMRSRTSGEGDASPWCEADLKAHFAKMDTKMDEMRRQLSECLDRIRELQDADGKSEASQESGLESCPSGLSSKPDNTDRSPTSKSTGGRLQGADALREISHVMSQQSKQFRNAWDVDRPPPPLAAHASDGTRSLRPASPRRTLTSFSTPEVLEPSKSMYRIAYGAYGRRLWNVLESDSSPAAVVWGRLWLCFIALSVLSTLGQSLSSAALYGMRAVVLEVVIELIFAAELLLRYSVCPNTPYFLSNPMNIMDMISVLPIGVRAAIGFSTVSVEDNTDFVTWILLCVVPVLRLFKMLRYTGTQWELFKKVFESVWGALDFLLFIGLQLLLIFAALIYLVEPRENIDSFARAMWLTLVTMTTVGYGDVFPSTDEGRSIIVMLMIFSAMYLSMPIGLVGSAFTQVWQDRDRIIVVDRMRRRLKQWGYSAEDTPMLFKRYDSDNDGEINLADFRKMLCEFGIGLSEDRIVELFGTFDNDNSGAVDDGEFIHVLFPQTWHAMKELERRREEEEDRRRKEKERERRERKAQSPIRQQAAQQQPKAASLSAWSRRVSRSLSGKWPAKTGSSDVCQVSPDCGEGSSEVPGDEGLVPTGSPPILHTGTDDVLYREGSSKNEDHPSRSKIRTMTDYARRLMQ